MAVIGTVEVDVVPSSKNFVNKLRGSIMPQADQVGRQWGDRFGAAAGDDARKRIELALGRIRDVNVDVDTADAEAKVAVLREEIDSLDKSNARVSKSAQGAGSSVSLLGTAIIGLGPALIPLAGVAAAGFGALAEGAITAAIAVKGVQREIAANTQLGRAYTQQVSGLVTAFHGLEHTGAVNAFGATAVGAATIQRAMPMLNADTRLYTQLLGNAADHVLHGLVAGYSQARPLVRDLADEGQRLARAFDGFASGGGFTQFIAWIRQNLPQVEQTIGDVAQAVGHLLEAGSGAGLNALTALDAIANAINAIPVGVLRTVIPLMSELFLAMQAFKAVNSVASSLQNFSGGLAGLSTAAAVVGPVLYGLNQRLTEHQQTVADNANAQTAFTNAIRADGGVLGAHVTQVVASSSAYQRWDAALVTAGLSAQDVTRYLSGSTKGFSDEQRAVLKTVSANALATEGHKSLAASLAEAQKQAQAEALAQRSANRALQESHPEWARAGAELGITASEYGAARDAALKQSQATAAATLQMRLQNDAAGLLQAALDRLGGNNLGVAQSETAAVVATKNAAKAFHDNGAAIQGNSDKAIANQQALQNKASADIALASAVGKQTGSTLRSNHALAGQKSALENALRAQGRLTPAVQAYIDKLYKIPARKTTQVDANIAAAQSKLATFQSYIHNLHGTNITVGADTSGAIASIQRLVDTPATKYVQVVTLNGPAPSGGRAGFATGGYLADGPGTETSDSMLVRASKHEFIVNAAATRQNRALLEQINSGRGIPGFAAGGLVGAAARRAATLAGQRAQIQFTVTHNDLPRLERSVTGSAATIAAAMEKLISDVNNAAKKGLGSSAIIGGLERDNRRLQDLARQRAALTDKLKAANQRLRDVRAAESQESGTIAAATRGSFAFGQNGYADTGSLIDALSNKSAQASKFQRDLLAARKHGVSLDIIKQLAEAGADSGSVTASTLAGASTAQVKQIDLLNSRLSRTSTGIGRQVSGQLYAGGVSSAQEYVRGLNSQLKSVQAAASRAARAVAATISRDLHLPGSASSPVHVTGKLEITKDGRANITGVLQGATQQITYGRRK